MIAHNPLHGSGQAGFPHPALTLGNDAHAAQGIGMTDDRQRQPATDEGANSHWYDFLHSLHLAGFAGAQGGGAMNHWMWPVSLVGILSTAVVCGTDMFFLTIGRPALRLASPSAGTEVMGFLHMFADARMPIWGISAILSNFLLVVLSRSGQRWFYFASFLMLILFVVIYARVSKPINRLQTEAARTGESLNNGRELQASWDRSVMIRVPLLVVSLLAQCLVLRVA
jgi:hypothetical protein